MRILITGTSGYIGSLLAPLAQAAGHEVVGFDAGYFDDCRVAPVDNHFRAIRGDVREVGPEHLEGCDAVFHLAALSNDPMGNLDPQLTFEINHLATVRLAQMAKQAGVERFVFSSSCSTYGAAGDDFLTESAAFHPVTPYGESKVRAERDLSKFASDDFSPVFLRNATAYGFSPRLRLDLVLNDFVAAALRSGTIVIRSDGTPWRPVVHVRDICRAFLAILAAPREHVHNQAFNVGSTQENYRVSELAEIVSATVPGSRIEYAPGGSPDKRCYRVDCGKIEAVLGFRNEWTVPRGAAELYAAYQEFGVDDPASVESRCLRLPVLKRLVAEGKLTSTLRWTAAEQERSLEMVT